MKAANQKGRYLVFKHDGYYPSGGLSDVCLQTDDLEQAKENCVTGYAHDDVYIYDRLEDKCLVTCWKDGKPSFEGVEWNP